MPKMNEREETGPIKSWTEHRNAVDSAAQDLFEAIKAFSKFLGHNDPNLRIVVTSSRPTDVDLVFDTITIHAWTDKDK